VYTLKHTLENRVQSNTNYFTYASFLPKNCGLCAHTGAIVHVFDVGHGPFLHIFAHLRVPDVIMLRQQAAGKAGKQRKAGEERPAFSLTRARVTRVSVSLVAPRLSIRVLEMFILGVTFIVNTNGSPNSLNICNSSVFSASLLSLSEQL